MKKHFRIGYDHLEIVYRPLHRRSPGLQILREYVEDIYEKQIFHCGILDVRQWNVYHFEQNGGYKCESFMDFMCKSRHGIDDYSVYFMKHTLTNDEQKEALKRAYELTKKNEGAKYCLLTYNCEVAMNVVLYGKRIGPNGSQALCIMDRLLDYCAESMLKNTK